MQTVLTVSSDNNHHTPDTTTSNDPPTQPIRPVAAGCWLFESMSNGLTFSLTTSCMVTVSKPSNSISLFRLSERKGREREKNTHEKCGNPIKHMASKACSSWCWWLMIIIVILSQPNFITSRRRRFWCAQGYQGLCESDHQVLNILCLYRIFFFTGTFSSLLNILKLKWILEVYKRFRYADERILGGCDLRKHICINWVDIHTLTLYVSYLFLYWDVLWGIPSSFLRAKTKRSK